MAKILYHTYETMIGNWYFNYDINIQIYLFNDSKRHFLYKYF